MRVLGGIDSTPERPLSSHPTAYGTVTAVSGLAVALLTKSPPVALSSLTVLAIGVLGFVVTLGITLYELRNTEIYDAAIGYARKLESSLRLPDGGQFNNRPPRSYRFLGLISIGHDPGLALIYGSALGAWLWPTTSAILSLLNIQALAALTSDGSPLSALSNDVVALTFAALAAVVFIYDERSGEP